MSTVNYRFNFDGRFDFDGPFERDPLLEAGRPGSYSRERLPRFPASSPPSTTLDSPNGQGSKSKPQDPQGDAIQGEIVPAGQGRLEENVAAEQRAAASETGRSLHRIAQVRRQQGMSTRSIARKLRLSSAEIRNQEQPSTDLKISQLLEWHRALDVPVVDLLIDGDSPLSDPISRRAHLLRVMKTARSIQEKAVDKSMARLSTMLVEQLIGLMPELRDVSAWHSVGQRRTQDEMGRIAEQTIPDSFFCE